MRAGYLQQELVRSRKMIKWSTPTTGWIQLRHDKSRIERWRENRYNVKKNT